jgi:hypothetical protein
MLAKDQVNPSTLPSSNASRLMYPPVHYPFYFHPPPPDRRLGVTFNLANPHQNRPISLPLHSTLITGQRGQPYGQQNSRLYTGSLNEMPPVSQNRTGDTNRISWTSSPGATLKSTSPQPASVQPPGPSSSTQLKRRRGEVAHTCVKYSRYFGSHSDLRRPVRIRKQLPIVQKLLLY